VSVRIYQVGFGDCFLLGFHYSSALADGRKDRSLLIDFGSTAWPKRHQARYPEIATDIQARTGGTLDAIVITHRHKDHLSGYGNDEAAAVIAGLKPKVVIRPWTEDPDAASDATGPALVGAGSRRFARGLDQAQAFAEAVTDVVDERALGFRGDLRALALHQLANQEAITRLDVLARATATRGDYLVAGGSSGLEALLPGVKTRVLGPPTIEQWPQVAGQREDDPEYWIRQRGLLGRMLAAVNAPPETVRVAEAAKDTEVDPGPLRWIVERLRAAQTHSLLRIVRELDDALNNTSVVLLFETGRRKLLFPGDAQIENWSYALTSTTAKAKALRAALPEVDLYKVGHHGSRNATPRSLVSPWTGRAKPLTTLLSTMPGVHGESEATAVPRTTLVDALGALGTLHRTDKFAVGTLSREVSASTRNDQPFAVVPP
jgi:glyoxylase-like metal-dependent hydrolase (beta-lactamase superfamily II)